MPPKAQPTSKKTDKKEKDKKIEDKTFGLKNKNKSSKVQKFIQTVEKTVRDGGQRKPRAVEPTKKELLAEKKAYETELNSLFKPVVRENKAPLGVDPKTVLCAYFKEGKCGKGSKCKFSHDLATERKQEKIDIYTDRRAVNLDPNECMDDWDQEKLEIVVQQKDAKRRSNETDIVCKYFLEAIEKKQYGWFWECPNGGDSCSYKHALPPGYVFKSAKKKDEDVVVVPIEELIEMERAKLPPGGTPCTLENFLAWKQRRAEKKKLEAEQREETQRREAAQAKKTSRLMSGLALFSYDPSVFVDDEEALNVDDYDTRHNPQDDPLETLPEGDGKLEADSHDDNDNDSETSCTTTTATTNPPDCTSTTVSTTTTKTTAPTNTETTSSSSSSSSSSSGAADAIDESLFCDEDDV